MSKIKRIDVFGAITLVSAIALILLGVSLGGNQYPWSSPVVYGTLIGGFADLGLFVLVEKYVAREPVMPLGVIFTRTPGFVALSNFFISMSQFAILYSIPLCVRRCLWPLLTPQLLHRRRAHDLVLRRSAPHPEYVDCALYAALTRQTPCSPRPPRSCPASTCRARATTSFSCSPWPSAVSSARS